jgi:hypothetical protein
MTAVIKSSANKEQDRYILIIGFRQQQSMQKLAELLQQMKTVALSATVVNMRSGTCTTTIDNDAPSPQPPPQEGG